MSVQVVQMPTVINTIYPIVLNPLDAIIGYQTSSLIATDSNVNAGYTSWSPTVDSFNYVYNVVHVNYNGIQNHRILNVNS